MEVKRVITLVRPTGITNDLLKENIMGGLLGGSKPKKITPPPVPDPPPIPVVSDESEEFAIKEQRRRSGASKAFLVGNLTPKFTGRKRTLG